MNAGTITFLPTELRTPSLKSALVSSLWDAIKGLIGDEDSFSLLLILCDGDEALARLLVDTELEKIAALN